MDIIPIEDVIREMSTYEHYARLGMAEVAGLDLVRWQKSLALIAKEPTARETEKGGAK